MRKTKRSRFRRWQRCALLLQASQEAAADEDDAEGERLRAIGAAIATLEAANVRVPNELIREHEERAEHTTGRERSITVLLVFEQFAAEFDGGGRRKQRGQPGAGERPASGRQARVR